MPGPMHRKWKSIRAAEAEFLSVEANEAALEALLGGGQKYAESVVWDALSTRWRRCRTFSEAFAACAGPARTWADFNLAGLRSLAPELARLDLPLECYEAAADAAMVVWHDGWLDAAQADWYADGGGLDEAESMAAAVAAWDPAELAEAMMGDDEVVVCEEMIEDERPALVLVRGELPALPAWAWHRAA